MSFNAGIGTEELGVLFVGFVQGFETSDSTDCQSCRHSGESPNPVQKSYNGLAYRGDSFQVPLLKAGRDAGRYHDPGSGGPPCPPHLSI